MHGSLATTMEKLINMLTFYQEHFIAKVEQEKDMLYNSIIANRGMDGYSITTCSKHPY